MVKAVASTDYLAQRADPREEGLGSGSQQESLGSGSQQEMAAAAQDGEQTAC